MFYLKTILHSSSMEEGGKAGVREGVGKEGRRKFMRWKRGGRESQVGEKMVKATISLQPQNKSSW